MSEHPKANGLHLSGDALMYVGDGPPIPVTNFKLELRQPISAEEAAVWAFWNRPVLKAQKSVLGEWEVVEGEQRIRPPR